MVTFIQLFCRRADEDHRQHTEYKCLHRAGEPVEIQRQRGRDAHGQKRDIAKDPAHNARDQPEQRVVCEDQRRIDQRADDHAGKDVSEVTERHRDGLKDLAEEVEGRHQEHRVAEALEIAAEAVRLDLIIGDEDKDDQRPAEQDRHIGGRRPEAKQRGKARAERKRKNGGNKRHQTHPLRAHVAADEVFRRHDDLFGDGLPLGNVLDLQIVRQPDAQQIDHQHHAPCDGHTGRDGDAAEDRNGEVYRSAVNIDVHSDSPLSLLSAPRFSRAVTIARRSIMTGCGIRNGISAEI